MTVDLALGVGLKGLKAVEGIDDVLVVADTVDHGDALGLVGAQLVFQRVVGTLNQGLAVHLDLHQRVGDHLGAACGQSDLGAAHASLADAEFHEVDARASASLHSGDEGNGGAGTDVVHVGNGVVLAFNQRVVRQLHGRGLGGAVVHEDLGGLCQVGQHGTQIRGLQLHHDGVVIQGGHDDAHRTGVTGQHAVIRDGGASGNHRGRPTDAGGGGRVAVDDDVVITGLEGHDELLPVGVTLQLLYLLTVEQDHGLKVRIAHQVVGQVTAEGDALVPYRILREHADGLIGHGVVYGNQQAEVTVLVGVGGDRFAILGVSRQLDAGLGLARDLNEIAVEEAAALRRGNEHAGGGHVDRELVESTEAVARRVDARHVQGVHTVLQVGKGNIAAVPCHGCAAAQDVLSRAEVLRAVHLDRHVLFADGVDSDDGAAHGGFDGVLNAEDGGGDGRSDHGQLLCQQLGGEEAGAVLHILEGADRDNVGVAFLKAAVGHVARFGIGGGVTSAQKEGAGQACGLLLFAELDDHVGVHGGEVVAVGIHLPDARDIAVVIGGGRRQIHVDAVVTAQRGLRGGQRCGLVRVDVLEGRFDHGLGDLQLALGILQRAHRLQAEAARRKVAGVGEGDLHGVARDGGGIHGRKGVDGAVFVSGVHTQVGELGKILARQRDGAAVLAQAHRVEVHEALDAVQGQLGGHGGVHRDLFSEALAVGKGDADDGGLRALVVGEHGVGVQVGFVVGVVVIVVPRKVVGTAGHVYLDAVHQILGRQLVFGGVGHGQERILIGGGIQHEAVVHPILAGGDEGVVDGGGGGQRAHVVGHGHVEDLAGLGVAVDGSVKGVHGGELGLGQSGLLTDLHVDVAAPVVDDGHADADDLDTAPGLLEIQTQRGAAQLFAADQEDPLGDLDRNVGVCLEERHLIRIVIVVEGDGASAHQNVKDVDADTEGQLQVGIPVDLTAQGINDIDTSDTDIGKRAGDSVQREGDVRPGGEDAEDGELAREHEGQRRQSVRDKEALVHLVDAGAGAAHPEDTEGIHGDTGIGSAHTEVDLIGDGEAVVALELQLGLHLKDHEVCRAGHTELPVVVDDLEGEHTLDVGHTVHVGGNAHLDAGVEADEAALTEEDVVHVEVEGALLALAPLSLLTLSLGVGGAELGGGIRAVAEGADVPLHLGVLQGGDCRTVRHEQVGGELGTEGDHAGVAVALLHECHLTVAEVQQQTCESLGGSVGTRPDEGDDLAELLMVEVAQLALLGIHRHGVELPFLNGGQGADAVPHLGIGAGRPYVAVDIHVDLGLMAVFIEVDRDGHAAVLDVEGLVDLDHFPAHQGQCLGLEITSLLGGEDVEVAAEHQHDVLDVGARIGKGLLGLVIDELVVVGLGGAVAAALNGDHTVDARADEAGVTGLGHVGYVHAERIADDVLGGHVVPVDDDLPGALAQGLIQHEGRGVAVGIDHDEILIQHYVIPAVHGTEQDAVLGFVAEEVEARARQVHKAATRDEHGVGRHARKADLGVVRGGAEHVELLGRNGVFLGEGRLAACVVRHDLDLTVVRHVGEIHLKVKADVQRFPHLHVRHGLGEGVLQIGVRDNAVSVVGEHLLVGVDGHGHLGEGLVADVLQLDGGGEVAGEGSVEILIGELILTQDHVARGDEVHGQLTVGGLVVGIYAVVKSHALARARGGDAAHGVVHSHGAVGGHEFKIVGICIVKGIRGRGLVIEHAGGQIVPMCEGDLRGSDDLACHSGIQRVCRDCGCGLAVVCKEIVAVVRAFDGLLALDRRVASVAVTEHVDGVILEAESGIHHHAGLHVIHGGARGLGHAVGDVGHTVLVGVSAHEGDGLDKAQTIHRPRGLDGVISRLPHAHGLAGESHVPIVATEDVISRHPTAGHAEGGEGGIEGGVGVQQVFVIVGFGELVALLGADVEAAVGLRHLHEEESVADLQITGIVYNLRDGFHRVGGSVGQRPDRQCHKQHCGRHQQRDHLHSYTFHIVKPPDYRISLT